MYTAMGGHSYSSSHHTGYHSSRIHYGSNSGGGGWGGECCGCCSSCTPLRIITIIGTFLVLVFYIIISATYPKSTDSKIELSLSETRIISFSSTWYQEISGGRVSFGDIASNTTYINDGTAANDVTLMRFTTRPPLTAVDSWILTEPSITISDYDHYPWSWFFYEGSTLTATWNYSQPITVYFVRSVKGYDHYYNDDESATSYIIRQRRSSSGNMTFTTTSDDIYFVIFENWDLPTVAYGGGAFNINSKLLDVGSPHEECSFPCRMDVPYKSDYVYVLYTPTVSSYAALGKGSANSVFSFYLHKASRSSFVALVVFIVPFLIVVAIVLVILAIVKRNKLRHCCIPASKRPINLDTMSSVNSSSGVSPPTSPLAPYPVTNPYPTPDPYPSAYPPSSVPSLPDNPSTPYPPQPLVYPPATAFTPVSAYPPPDAYPPTSQPPSNNPYPPPDAYSSPSSPSPSNNPYPPPVPSFPPSDAYTPNPLLPPPSSSLPSLNPS